MIVHAVPRADSGGAISITLCGLQLGATPAPMWSGAARKVTCPKCTAELY